MDRWIHNQKRAVVEAVQLTSNNIQEIADWTGGRIVEEEDKINNRMYDGLNVPTPIGNRRLSLGMYAVKFQGQFFLALRREFEGQYSRMTPIGTPEVTEEVLSPRESKVLKGKFNGPPWFDRRER